ncbi:FAD-binding protein [Amycolatopsis albidoflavus]
MGDGWDDEADLVVVGFGAAGACAAIEAAAAGADVLVLDRFRGGGATALSGGIVYAGGGTDEQIDAGIEDTADAMFDYLRFETRGAVSDETLRRFCRTSPAQIAWLKECGVPFDGSLCTFKTSYPPDGRYLYYSGNELARRDQATPSPRGHRVVGKGGTGRILHEHLATTAQRLGVRMRSETTAVDLIRAGGRVAGVECRALTPRTARVHRLLGRHHGKLTSYAPAAAKLVTTPIQVIEQTAGRPWRVRARHGVVLASGGFVHNPAMLRLHAPAYVPGRPLGTIADDGSAIALGRRLGAEVSHLDRVSAWRFVMPPTALGRGVLVDARGVRVCDETLYGSTVAEAIVERHRGNAYLLVDKEILSQAKRELAEQTVLFQRVQAHYLFTVGRRGNTITDVAVKAGIDPARLRQTIDEYNFAARNGLPDAEGKTPDYVRPVEHGPFYVFDFSLRNSPLFPCTMITLGGLVVEETTGLVLSQRGGVIDGLYAAGRAAVGMCSNSYVSGLSLADCVFSGRRAGRHAVSSIRKHRR